MASTASEKVDEDVFCAESVTVMTTLNVPEAVGVPVMAPPVERVKPAGAVDPLAAAQVHVYPVPEPPVAASVAPGYAVPWYPAGRVVGVVMVIPPEMVRLNVALAVFEAESVTVMLKDRVPLAVGLPLSTPAEESVRPAGSVEPLVTAQV